LGKMHWPPSKYLKKMEAGVVVELEQPDK